MPSGVRGVGKIRRIMRRLELEVQREYAQGSREIADDMLATVRELTPRRDHGGKHVRDALSARVTNRGMTIRVGLLTPARRRRHFYLRILDAGRKPIPNRNIPAMQPLNILSRTFNKHLDDALERNARNLQRALIRTARGE